MEKYFKALENLNKRFGSEWIKPAVDTLFEVALQDYFAGGLTLAQYDEIVHAGIKILYPEVKDTYKEPASEVEAPEQENKIDRTFKAVKEKTSQLLDAYIPSNN